jgi:putative transposase
MPNLSVPGNGARVCNPLPPKPRGGVPGNGARVCNPQYRSSLRVKKTGSIGFVETQMIRGLQTRAPLSPLRTFIFMLLYDCFLKKSTRGNGQLQDALQFNYYSPDRSVDQHFHRLPHWQQGTAVYFVTWRLADSIPQAQLRQLQFEKEVWLNGHPQPWSVETEEEYWERYGRRIEKWLDSGHGSCVLRSNGVRRIVAETLRHFDEDRYSLVSFVIMPNHVHALFSLACRNKIEQVLHSWKRFSAREINRVLGRKGPLWQSEYWDRMIRSDKHFWRVVQYVRDNPVKAHLHPGEYTVYEALP